MSKYVPSARDILQIQIDWNWMDQKRYHIQTAAIRKLEQVHKYHINRVLKCY